MSDEPIRVEPVQAEPVQAEPVHAEPVHAEPVHAEPDWQAILSHWSFAHGGPVASGQVKADPDDFQVFEQMDIEPEGSGEHIWLQIRKCRQNTDRVARMLAKFCRVPYRDVGYSGLKDFFAVTEQWFSIRLPGVGDLDWTRFELSGVTILRVARHHRKIQRGTHRANRFRIIIRNLSADNEAPVNQRLELIQRQGVPNYFGPQRFGRNAGNLPQVREMLAGLRRINDRNLRGILLSAARSWLFNTILSERILDRSWQQLQPGEPANLDGTGSIFNADQAEDEVARLQALDIHPTAPLWGEMPEQVIAPYRRLHNWEVNVVEDYSDIAAGLVAARLACQRRPLRMKVSQLEWQWQADHLTLEFALQKGQFATSVLRELIADTAAA